MKKIIIIAFMLLSIGFNIRADLIPTPQCVAGQWQAPSGWNMVTVGIACKETDPLPTQIKNADYQGNGGNFMFITFLLPAENLLLSMSTQQVIHPLTSGTTAWVNTDPQNDVWDCPGNGNPAVAIAGCPVQR